MKTLFLASAALALCASAACAAPAEGRWSFALSTAKGDCARNVELAAFLRGGKLATIGGQRAQANGAANDGGDMWAQMSLRDTSYRLQGRLTGPAGQGSWSTTDAKCSGFWTARKG